MGHRGASESEPDGHFSMAEHADEWSEHLEDNILICEALDNITKQDARDKATDVYKVNKAAKVGTQLTCPSCGKGFKKASYQQAFCQRNKHKKGSTCKDVYHNVTSDVRRARAHKYSKK